MWSMEYYFYLIIFGPIKCHYCLVCPELFECIIYYFTSCEMFEVLILTFAFLAVCYCI